MKCRILFSGKNKKNISKYRLLKILPRVLSVKVPNDSTSGQSRSDQTAQTCSLIWTYAVQICLMTHFRMVRPISYVAFVLLLFVPHLSFFWCLGKVLFCDCDIS